MKPWEVLGKAKTPEGAEISLTRRGDEYLILRDGKDLMGSRMKGSEEALATLGCDRARTMDRPTVLIGGLGMGFTLRAAIDLLPPGATAVVSELMPVVVEWNRAYLGHFTQHVLHDPRVKVEVEDVADVLRKGKGRFDAIMLDVDNGPAAFSQAANVHLYDDGGIARAKAALRPKGVFAIWSAGDERKFEARLRDHGFEAETHHVRARGKQGGRRHTIFIGRL